jgi:glutathione S-transferase
MIRVHHLNNSRSQRVLWLLEEIGLDYDIVRYRRDPRTMLAPAALQKIHPLGKAPLVEIDGELLAETGFIVDDLVGRFAPALAPPPGSALHRRYAYWLHYAEGSAMPPLLLRLVLGKMGPLGWPARGFVNGQIALHLDYLEAALAGQPWFLGAEFSAADIMLSFPLEVAAATGGLTAARPQLAAFLGRAQARPAYHRAIERGGAYSLA